MTSNSDPMSESDPKIDHYKPEISVKTEKGWFGQEHISIQSTGKMLPVFKTVEDQCQYNCKNAENKRKCMDQCLTWEPFFRCMSKHRGTGIPQCMPNFFH